jgi:hypothetical protein
MTDQRVNRRRMLKKGAGVVGALGALAALHGAMPARAADTPTTGGDMWGLEGTWISTVALGSLAPFQSLSTYAAGGGVVTTAQTSLRGAPGMPGSVSSHHGTWARTGELTFQRHLVAFLFGPTGVPTGTHTVDQAILMAGDGQSYSAHGTVTVGDVTGKVLHTTSAGIEQATRIAATGMHGAAGPSGQ